MKTRSRLTPLPLFASAICCICPAQAAQLVTPFTNGSQYAAPLATISYTAVYSVSTPQTATETGIGLRVHYDSSQLTPTNTQRYSDGAQPIGAISNDSADYDTDPQTDKFFILAWIDFNAQWPGSNKLPLNLFTTDFVLQSGFTETAINLTATGTADNTGFETSSQRYTLSPTPTPTPTPTPKPTLDPVSSQPTDAQTYGANGQPIPTLSEWMLMLMGLLLAALAACRPEMIAGSKRQ